MKLTERLEESQRQPLLWLDYADYAAELLAGGRPPWLNVADCIAWVRKAQSLLKSDVVALPIQVICEGWLRSNQELCTKMAARNRVGHPLKTLLNDPDLRSYLVELTAGFRASFGSSILALVIPSPRAWLLQAYELAFEESNDVEVDDDAIDSASVYVADFLRAFGAAGIDAVLLQEDAGVPAVSAVDLDLCQPILNVAAHYRWDVGMHASEGFSAGASDKLGFTVSRERSDARHSIDVLPSSFWNDDMAIDVRGDRNYARIPPGLTPEVALQRLAAIR